MAHYLVVMLCWNCGHRWVERIAKGASVGERRTCPHCRCNEGYRDPDRGPVRLWTPKLPE